MWRIGPLASCEFSTVDTTNEKKYGMLRKHYLLTLSQVAYLKMLSRSTGESEGHFVREAIEEHARLRGNFFKGKIKGAVEQQTPVK